MQEIHPARSLRHQDECKYCTPGTTGRGTDRERCKENASVIGGTGRRSAASAQPGNPREPRLREVVGDYRSGEREHCVFNLIVLDNCQRARFREDRGRCRSDNLAYSRNDSSRGACRDAPSRANASFADARGA